MSEQVPAARAQFRWPFWLVVAAILVAVGGNFTFLTGSQVGFKVLRKVSFSLSEVWVNLDEMGNMPAILARARYPLTLEALTRRAIASGAEPDLSTDQTTRLRAGMTRIEVQEILGRPNKAPDHYMIAGARIEHWNYSSGLQGRYVNLQFTDGVLTKIND
jgi:hypothetical protein